MLEFFLSQVTPAVLILLMGFLIFSATIGFLLGGSLGGYRGWDWDEAWDGLWIVVRIVGVMFVGLWLAGLAMVFLVDLLGGVR